MLLFVYGTLKRDHGANYMLSMADYLGEATTANSYLLLKDINYTYPFLLNIPVQPITGELYELDQTQLDRIDAYEGHPDLFKRQIIPLSDGRQAWCYFYTELTQIQDF